MMPGRPASQQVKTQPISMAVLVERMENFDKRQEEKFAELYKYLDLKFESFTLITSGHEKRICSNENDLDDIRPVARFTKWVGIAIGLLIITGVVAILTHQVTLVFH
jgi:hypothetical protein